MNRPVVKMTIVVSHSPRAFIRCTIVPIPASTAVIMPPIQTNSSRLRCGGVGYRASATIRRALTKDLTIAVVDTRFVWFRVSLWHLERRVHRVVSHVQKNRGVFGVSGKHLNHRIGGDIGGERAIEGRRRRTQVRPRVVCHVDKRTAADGRVLLAVGRCPPVRDSRVLPHRKRSNVREMGLAAIICKACQRR